MKRNTKLRILPFDHLQKMGRYDPEVCRPDIWPRYPRFMMKELKMVAEEREEVRFLENYPMPEYIKAKYKYKKFIRIEIESRDSQWIIPSNWVVRV